MVVALSGWSDAAQVATGTVAYLARKLEAKKFAEVNPDEFYNFPDLRPTVTIETGVITSVRMPRCSFFYRQGGASAARCHPCSRCGTAPLLAEIQRPYPRYR